MWLELSSMCFSLTIALVCHYVFLDWQLHWFVIVKFFVFNHILLYLYFKAANVLCIWFFMDIYVCLNFHGGYCILLIPSKPILRIFLMASQPRIFGFVQAYNTKLLHKRSSSPPKHQRRSAVESLTITVLVPQSSTPCTTASPPWLSLVSTTTIPKQPLHPLHEPLSPPSTSLLWALVTVNCTSHYGCWYVGARWILVGSFNLKNYYYFLICILF